jgi:hypothetical protein
MIELAVICQQFRVLGEISEYTSVIEGYSVKVLEGRLTQLREMDFIEPQYLLNLFQG